MNSRPYYNGWLVLPRLRVQNANAISSPLTWGFPAITAFLGLMWALERKTRAETSLAFHGVGVVCHSFTPLVSKGGYTRAFRLTRNPVDHYGATPSIVEEGRAHMEVSLIFAVGLDGDRQSEEDLKLQAGFVQDVLASQRVAGGSVLPSRFGPAPFLELMDTPENQGRQFHELRRRAKLVPGFALVSRPDLLPQRMKDLNGEQRDASHLEAWLDLSRLNRRAEKTETPEGGSKIEWSPARPKKGWIVPLPIGYAALTDLYEGGRVKKARDMTTPFRFVESVYSFGEWLGVHRLKNVEDLLWYGHYDEPGGLYLAQNDYISPSQEI